MDINKLSGNNLRPEGATAIAKQRGATAVDSPSTPQTGSAIGESVTLTEAAKTMSAARDKAGEIPFDDAKVQSIKAAIAEGRYRIDNQQLAKSMLDFEGLFA